MNKHAYLIMAHHQFDLLKKLLLLLDDDRNDIYVHIDRKAKNFNYNEYYHLLRKSKLYFTDRTSVVWGGYSQINCELLLLKKSIIQNYTYYHLLSGVDLPLKTQDDIHTFFRQNHGAEFIHFDQPIYNPANNSRLQYFHFFQDKIGRTKSILSHIEKISLWLQEKLNINRLRKTNLPLQKGANWFSITNDLAHYVVNQEENIRRIFKHSLCCDEVFLQTIVYNSKYRNYLYYKDLDNNYISIMRYIDWKRGTPYIFQNEDYEQLINSKYLFARKFDSSVDKLIIERLSQYLLS